MKHTIMLDEERELKYNIGSLYFLADELDIEPLEVSLFLSDPKKLIRQLPKVVHAGLLYYYEELGYDKLKKISSDLSMHPAKLTKIIESVGMAMTENDGKDSKNVSSPKATIPGKKKKN